LDAITAIFNTKQALLNPRPNDPLYVYGFFCLFQLAFAQTGHSGFKEALAKGRLLTSKGQFFIFKMLLGSAELTRKNQAPKN